MYFALFVRKAQSSDYLVVDVDEYYTSQKCPKCQNFVTRGLTAMERDGGYDTRVIFNRFFMRDFVILIYSDNLAAEAESQTARHWRHSEASASTVLQLPS